jgi:cytochrome c biogenesis protein CcmG, thiol:disulfide interchange protein DsbE
VVETTIDDGGDTSQTRPTPPGASPPGSGGMGTARITSIVVGVVVLALVVLFAIGRDTGGSGTSPLLGTRVPPVTGELVGGGGTYDIDDHRGSWVLVNFFGTWCPPCVAEHPELVALEEWGAERGDVELVSVVFNEPDLSVVEAFFAERGGDWPVIDNPTVPVAFQVAQIPETFLVSPAGQVVSHIPGQITAAEIEALIEGTD